VVEVQLRMTQLNSVDQKYGIVSVSGYLRTWWTDGRLAFNGTADGGCLDSITVAGEAQSAFWMPDVYLHNAFSKEIGASSLVVHSDGRVFHSEQVQLAVINTLDFGKLPFDSHVAEFVFASYTKDISRMRIVPRGGVVGAARSGVGVVAPPITNKLWNLMEGAEENGFETAGTVEVIDGWDYVKVSFPYARAPKFLIDQVLFPAMSFILMSYIQFFLDPTAVPARATLAVVPVWMMCTLSSYVYRTVPEGSQRMWLIDNLFFFLVMCTLAALEFGAVEAAVNLERSRAHKWAKLMEVESHARLVAEIAHKEGITIMELLEECRATLSEPGDGGDGGDIAVVSSVASSTAARPMASSVSAAGSSQQSARPSMTRQENRRYVASRHGIDIGIKECDLLIISYTKGIFDAYDGNHSKTIEAVEVSRALTYFNIYLSKAQSPEVICMFLRDQGFVSPEDESSAELSFSQFLVLLLDIEQYKLKLKSGSLRCYFQTLPPTKRWDVAARFVFPVLVIAQQVMAQLLLSAY